MNCFRLLLACLLTAPEARSDDNVQLAKSAVLAFHANVDSFTNYKCRYRYTSYAAQDEKAALAGQQQGALSCEFTLIVDRAAGRERFDCHAPEPPPRGAANRPRDHAFAPRAEVSYNDQTLRYSSAYGHLIDAPRPHFREYDPLTMFITESSGKPSPKHLLSCYDADVTPLVSRGIQEISKSATVHCGFDSRPLGTIVHDYFFDPSRGHLPLLSVKHRGPPGSSPGVYNIHLLDSQEFSGGRWFPTRVLMVLNTQGVPQVSAIEMRVLQLDVDKPLTDADFTLELPAGTVIQNQEEVPNYRAFRLRRAEKVRAESIPEIAKMLERSGKQPLTDTAIPPPAVRFYQRTWFVVSLAVVALGLGLVGWRLLRKPRA